ncbi:hypothetical protein IUS99_14245 [Mycobacteroides abscessus subsp. massiliense]|uniref:TPR repeat region-containing protein n=1 Tax=Mycobacteroides abscessus TaxID=36809 RepID=UPI0019D31813|nr:hypothetical protein [Mycobacteroides abscessus]MBN7317927.1 hypothetical protein [Mycobacteroides abscessus subsp. massiliense]
MGRPAKNVVYKANATALGDLAEPTRTVGSKILDAANTVHDTITGLEWEGVGKDAAQGRAERELAQDRKIVAGHDGLADAYRNGAAVMQPMITDLTSTGRGLEADSFDVSQDWAVTDTFDYRAGRMAMRLFGFTEQQANDRMNQLQAQRGQEAAAATVKLQRLADDLGHADQQTADAITKAKADIAAAAPTLAGLAGGDQAVNDLSDIRAGKGTPEEKARVQAAMSSWTPDQLAALAAGKPATMPQGQYDYLKSLMHGVDSMSATDINKTMKDAGLQGQTGDALRMMTNPNVQTANGDRGGLNNAPKSIQELLQKNPVQWIEGGPDKMGGTVRVPLGQFDALDEMLGAGNSNLALGSDVDRAMLNQAARITSTVDNGGHQGIGVTEKGYDDVVPFKNVNNTINGMLGTASSDHQAVTDFLTGANDPHSAGAARMNELADGPIDRKQSFLDLATHKFDEGQRGLSSVIDWMGQNAYKPDLEGWDAAASANATGHLFADNKDLLAAGISDGHGGYKGLGQVNPDLVRTATKNLIPFLGNLDGVDVPGIQGDAIRGFTNTKDLTNMIQVLNSDPASAEAINRGAAAWEQHFAYEFGRTGDSELGRHAGQLTQSVQHANQAELNAFRANDNWDAVRAYKDQSKNWDTAKEILNDAAGYIPGGGTALSLGKDLANLAAGDAKDSVLGIPGDPHKLSDTAWQKALTNTDTNFNQLVDGYNRQFNMVQGFIDGHQGSSAQFQNVPTSDGPIVNFVDQNGRLDWDAVTRNQGEFNKIYDQLSFGNPTVHIGSVWDSREHGYQSGKEDDTINSVNLPRPTDANRPPRP